MTSKGQITVPRSIRDALDLKEGDSVLFRVDGLTATLSKVPSFLDLAGTVPVPRELRGRPWSEIIAAARLARAKRALGVGAEGAE